MQPMPSWPPRSHSSTKLLTWPKKSARTCRKSLAESASTIRIGSKFLHAGPGFGGSCFHKDTRALIKTAQDYDAPLRIVEAVNSVNDTRKRAMARKVAAPHLRRQSSGQGDRCSRADIQTQYRRHA